PAPSVAPAAEPAFAAAPVAAAAPMPAAAPAMPTSRPASRPYAPSASTPFPRKDRPMDDRRPPAATPDAAVMSDYFDTMRQFLETQERVMSAFMGAAPAMP